MNVALVFSSLFLSVTSYVGTSTETTYMEFLFNLQNYSIEFSFQWAHFPNIHFGLGSNESSKKLDEAIVAPIPQQVQGLY